MSSQEGVMPLSFPKKIHEVLTDKELKLKDVAELSELVAQTLWYSGDTQVNPVVAKALCRGVSALLVARDQSIDELDSRDAHLIALNYKLVFHNPVMKQLLDKEAGVKMAEEIFLNTFM